MKKRLKNIGWKFDSNKNIKIYENRDNTCPIWFESRYGIKENDSLEKLAKNAIKRKKDKKEDPALMLTGKEVEKKSYPFYGYVKLYDILIKNKIIIEQDPIINI